MIVGLELIGGEKVFAKEQHQKNLLPSKIASQQVEKNSSDLFKITKNDTINKEDLFSLVEVEINEQKIIFVMPVPLLLFILGVLWDKFTLSREEPVERKRKDCGKRDCGGVVKNTLSATASSTTPSAFP